MATWNDLLEFARKGEQWLETEAAHVAVLTARMMHADRAAASYQEAAPVESAPVVEAPAAEVSSGS